MSLKSAASPHQPTQLSYAQGLASPRRRHKGGSFANKTRTKFSSLERLPAKVANPYDCPSRRRATFNDDANETRIFSSADENPWDRYDSALDDKSASEEESTSEYEAGACTGEKVKDAAWSHVRTSFYRLDIDAHEQQLRADAMADITDNTPGCSTPAVARTAANAGRPPSKVQADSTTASTGQDEEKNVLALDSLPGSWEGKTSVSSIKDQQMEDTELLAHTGNDTWTRVWSVGLLRLEWPGGRGLPSPYTLIPQDSPLLKLPWEGLAAHAIEALGMSKHGA